MRGRSMAVMAVVAVVLVWPGAASAAFDGARSHAVLTAGAGPNQGSLVSGDFDRDGRADVAVTDQAAGTVVVLRGQGDGSFAAPWSVPVGTQPGAVVALDADGDDVLDLVAGSTLSRDLVLLRGAGDGTFTVTARFPTASGPQDLAVADLDGDRRPDVIGVGSFGTLEVLRNDHGRLVAAPPMSTGAAAGSLSLAVAVGDFDGDRVVDVATAEWVRGPGRSVVRTFRGRGDGSLVPDATSHGVAGAAEAMRAVDADCDGRDDLVVPVAGGGLQVLAGRPGGGVGDPVEHETRSGSNAVTSADFDRDGRRDLAVSFFAGSVDVYGDVCAGRWTATETHATTPQSEALATPDLDADGDADLVVAGWFSPNLAVLLNTAPRPPAAVPAPTAPLRLDVLRGRSLRVGRRARIVVRVTRDGAPVRAAIVRATGPLHRRAAGRTDRAGRAVLAVRPTRRGTVVLRATRAGTPTAVLRLRVRR